MKIYSDIESWNFTIWQKNRLVQGSWSGMEGETAPVIDVDTAKAPTRTSLTVTNKMSIVYGIYNSDSVHESAVVIGLRQLPTQTKETRVVFGLKIRRVSKRWFSMVVIPPGVQMYLITYMSKSV